ncbi:MAG: hypothetical protein ACFFCS_28400, partial [Candidatus Hodarchaeota archaeon]
ITIPIACDKVIQAKAEEMGILTTGVGIVFIIERPEDFIVAMEEFRKLFQSASDLAGRLPFGIDVKDIKEKAKGAVTSWFKGLGDKVKSKFRR